MSFQLAIGSNVRKSPYFDATVAHGVASFSIYNHMIIPAHFGDPEGEYQALLDNVVMWDVAGQRQVELAGPDAEKLVQYLTTRDISDIVIGQAKYVPICDHDGTFINDPVLQKIMNEGVRRRRVGLVIAGDKIGGFTHPHGIYLGEDVVGTVTDAVYSPRLDKNIAVALLNSEIADDEQGLEADIGEERRPATVSGLPFC